MTYCVDKSNGPCHCQPHEGYFCGFNSEVAELQRENTKLKARVALQTETLHDVVDGLEAAGNLSKEMRGFLTACAAGFNLEVWLLRQKAAALYDLGCTEPSLMHDGIPAWTINCIDEEVDRLRDEADKAEGGE
jgi:hypothetical protein